MSIPAAWTDIETAIYDWAATSGLPVVWAQQQAPRPTGAYIALRVQSLRQVGVDWMDREDNPASTGDDGEELIATARGTRIMTVALQAFAGPPPSTGVGVGASAPLMVLEQLIARARLPVTRDAWRAVDVGLLTAGPAQSIDGFLGAESTVFEPRAVMEVTMSVTSEVSAFQTVIETVQITNQIPDPDEEFEVSAG